MVQEINSIEGLSLGLDPLALLLGVCDRVAPGTHRQLFVFYTTFYARKVILNWKKPDPLQGLPMEGSH